MTAEAVCQDDVKALFIFRKSDVNGCKTGVNYFVVLYNFARYFVAFLLNFQSNYRQIVRKVV